MDLDETVSDVGPCDAADGGLDRPWPLGEIRNVTRTCCKDRRR